MEARQHERFIRRITKVVLFFLVCHALLCVYFVVTPSTSFLHSTIIGKTYTTKFLIGPFFTEEKIVIAPSFLLSYKTSSGVWSAYVNTNQSWMDEYYQRPWLYHNIKKDHLLASLIRDTYNQFPRGESQSFAALHTTSNFCTLNRFIRTEILRKTDIDSVRWVYIFSRYYKHATEPKADTVWNFTFNPNDVCK